MKLQTKLTNKAKELVGNGHMDSDTAALLTDARNRLDEYEDQLGRIMQWVNAYPVRIFPPLDDRELRTANEVLEARGISMSRMHASWARHILQGIGEIITLFTWDHDEGE